jgi:hypothetical protein
MDKTVFIAFELAEPSTDNAEKEMVKFIDILRHVILSLVGEDCRTRGATHGLTESVKLWRSDRKVTLSCTQTSGLQQRTGRTFKRRN